MSRIGKQPVKIPAGVDLKIDNHDVRIKGPLGELFLRLHDGISADTDKVIGQVVLSVEQDRAAELSAFYGLDRALLQDCVIGVHVGYKKELEIQGTGYQAKLVGESLELQIGFCHPVLVPIPGDLEVEVPQPTQILISGIDKQRVGQLAAVIRKVKPPEPYKGKGIRYKNEEVRRKAGKQMGAGG